MKELEARLCDQRSRQKKDKEARGNSGGKAWSTAQLRECLPTRHKAVCAVLSTT